MKREKNFNPIIYGLDIETTTVNNDCGDPVSFMYSFCISTLDFRNGKYTELVSGRNYLELDYILNNINNNSKDSTTIIYIHNFSYEFSFFINNLKFFRCNWKDLGDYDYLFMSANAPLFVRIKNIEFRDSLKLLGKSIKKLGKELNLPKLDYDYQEIRTPLSHLSDTELEYNFRDVEIMLKSVYRLYANNPYIKNIESLAYTKTGIMRKNCELNAEVNEKKTYYKNGKKKTSRALKLNNFLSHIEKATSFSQLRLWHKLFQGGLVYSNPECVGTVIENLASFDFSSDYPFQMLTRVFPSEFEEIKENRLERLERLLKPLKAENYKRHKFSQNMFNCIVEVDYMQCKWNFTPLSTSKIINIKDLHNTKNCIVINGKIHSIKKGTKIKMYMTCIDLLTLKLFYDFNISNCYYLEIAHRYKRSNKFKLNSVVFNAKKKIEYKRYNELIENNNFKTYNKDDIDDDFFREQINKCKDYIEQCDTSHYLYQNVKSDLNALYGDNAQHLLREKYILDDNHYIKKLDTFENYQKARVKTSYIYGLYVPAYARASILYIAYMFLTNNIDIYYIDTDSIKVKNSDLADRIVNKYNKWQLQQLGEYDYLKFGILEKEYIAEKFSSLGTKSYIKLEDGKLKATISGLPGATRLYNELYDVCGKNFDELIENCYHYGVKFDKTITKKLSSNYNLIYSDVKVGEYEDSLYSGVVLSEVEVTMRDFNSKTWYIYARLIAKLYNKNYNDFVFSTVIKRNKKGVIEFCHENLQK